jgi:2-isopropylmalate synthase
MSEQSISPVTRDTSDYVRIFDTTLRDGEQSPGATMTASEKLEVARALSRLGVDVIEAGFPAASPDDFEAVKSIAERVGAQHTPMRASHEPPIICALARASRPDIERAALALAPAKKKRIHLFLATSDIHLKHKLRMSRDEMRLRANEMVAFAKTFCDDIEFSPEDAGRSDREFLYTVLEGVIAAGATTLNIPDTVGYTLPDEFGALIAGIRANVKGIEKVILSVHCHDDLGLATANTLAGLRNGARQAEVTINGIGERAGNASLEEIVMAIRTRAPLLGLSTGIRSEDITRVSRLVSSVTGMPVQANKAIVGANAFAHESGIHQDGMLKNEETYEIMRPESVGATQTRLVLGKHSGRHAFSTRLRELGYSFDGPALEKVFARFKSLAERRKQVTDADIEALVAGEDGGLPEIFKLEGLLVGCGTQGMATATVRLKGPDGLSHVHAAVGTGPVDAAFKAVDAVVGAEAVLAEYSVHSVTSGIDALGDVSVRVHAKDRSGTVPERTAPRSRMHYGHGADVDIIVASVKAYLAALNRLLATDTAAPRRHGAARAEGVRVEGVTA